VHAPPDRLLKTLAIYWDELILPDYVERAGSDDFSSEFAEMSDAFAELEGAGVVLRTERTADLPPVDGNKIPPGVREIFDEGSSVRRMSAVLAPLFELSRERQGEDLKTYLRDHQEELNAAGAASIKNILLHAADHYMGRMRDAFALANAHHLAPVARSSVSHVASMIGAPDNVPRSEAALLSTVIQAFEIDPDTPVEQILRFREKNGASLGRFRSSLVDLSEGLREENSPTTLLAEARDTYKNRVVPALGDLEEVLTEGKIRFFVRSLVGATALTLAPVNPVKAVEGSATLMGQTIDYAFSRERLVREHPFGYLHQVSAGLGGKDVKPTARALESIIEDPEDRVREIFVGDLRSSLPDVVQSLWLPERPDLGGAADGQADR